MPENNIFPFDYSTTCYSLKNALSLALLCEHAYRTSDTDGKFESNDRWKQRIETQVLPSLGLAGETFHGSKTDTQGIVASNPHLIVIAFRGTEQRIDDWLTNLDFGKEQDLLDGKVHSGFYKATIDTIDIIERSIGKMRALHATNGRRPAQSLWFTGHSLGGALAMLAVSRFIEEDYPVDGLYTFGQPRTGDRNFARNFNLEFQQRAFRFVNNNDPVTRIPPRSWQYSHTGSLRYITESGAIEDDIGFWNRFLDRLHGRIQDILEWGTDGLKDHSLSGEYIPKLSAEYSK